MELIIKILKKLYNIDKINYFNYKKKERLLTQNELKFYKILKQITNKYNLELFTQVALYEIIQAKKIKYFNKIKSKTIDFVITDKNLKTKICIELDDKTHYWNKRIERDLFINELFFELGIKLLRIDVKPFYNIEKIERKIKESL